MPKRKPSWKRVTPLDKTWRDPCIYKLTSKGEVVKIGKAWKGLFIRYNAGYAPIINALLECGCAKLEVLCFPGKSERFIRAREKAEIEAHEKKYGKRPPFNSRC